MINNRKDLLNLLEDCFFRQNILAYLKLQEWINQTFDSKEEHHRRQMQGIKKAQEHGIRFGRPKKSQS